MMTITRTSRILAIVLAFAMILSLVPVMAAAASAENYVGYAEITYPEDGSATYEIKTNYFNAEGKPIQGTVAVRIASPVDDLFYYDMLAVKEDGEISIQITMDADEDVQGRYDVEFINEDLGDQRYACYYFTADSEGNDTSAASFEEVVADQIEANNFDSIEVQQMLATSDAKIYKKYVVENTGVSKEFADEVAEAVATALEGIDYDGEYIDNVEVETVVALFDSIKNNSTKSYMDTFIGDSMIMDLIEEESGEDFDDARSQFKMLSSSAKAQVATKMCAYLGSFDNIQDIVDAFIDSLPEENDDYTPGPGGGNKVLGGGTTKPSTIAVTSVFTDIDTTAYWWMIEPLQVLYDNGFINGRTATTFAPGENITRAEYLKILVAELGLDAPGATENFDDVSDYDWYYKYVVVGSALGIVKGRSATEFAPNELITREEISVMTMRAVRVANIKLNVVSTGATFTDQASISDWAVEDVVALKEAGIVSGRDTGAFDPKANAIRAEAVKILHGIYAAK